MFGVNDPFNTVTELDYDTLQFKEPICEIPSLSKSLQIFDYSLTLYKQDTLILLGGKKERL
jgi:hypothetical protein